MGESECDGANHVGMPNYESEDKSVAHQTNGTRQA